MGAIASGGVTILSRDLIAQLGVPPAAVEETIVREREELGRRERSYRGGRSAPDLLGRTVLLVDDGLATGATMRAAVAAVRKLGPRAVVAAAPVASPAACEDVAAEADACVCVSTPPDFTAVGEWYADFDQTTDEEVRALLAAAVPERSPVAAPRR
jgi:predicted phosphoribosyltransferase